MIIKLKEVVKITSLSRPTIYRFIAVGSFPRQVKLGGKSVGWVEEEVIAWIKDRINQRDAVGKK